MNIYLDLFLTFLKIGAVSFGGGYGMLPLIKEECVSHNWLSEESVLNFIAVSESTPGPIAINMATFVGSSQAGIGGAALATLGVVLPAFIIIIMIAALVRNLFKYQGVQAFLGGIRPTVSAMILSTSLTLFLSGVLAIKTVKSQVAFDWQALVIFAVIFFTATLYKHFRKKAISPIILIIISAGLGMGLYSIV